MDAGAVLVIFARAPVAGETNTRLIPVLGALAAADLQRELIELRMQQFARDGRFGVELCCAPDTSHEIFQSCAHDHGVTLTSQHGEDLGARMAHAMSRAFTEFARVVLIGTDAPAVDADTVARALSWLDTCDAVLQPAEDGGYVLIAMRRDEPAVFSSVHWGSAQVLQATRANLSAAGLRWRELETVWDIDTPEDLARYRRSFTP